MTKAMGSAARSMARVNAIQDPQKTAATMRELELLNSQLSVEIDRRITDHCADLLGQASALRQTAAAIREIARRATELKAELLKEEEYKELSEAYTFLNSVRFNHQLKAMKNGEKLSNNIVPNDLSQFERNHLRDAFQIIAKHQKGALFRFSGGRGVL